MKINIEIIKRCKQKDRLSQKELYLQLLPYLRAVCQRYLFQRIDLKDVLQESFVLIFKNIEKYDEAKGPFHSWASRIVINATLNYNKRNSITNEDEFQLEYHDKGAEPEAYKNMSDEDLLELLKNMPRNYFEVFNLSVIDGFEHDEIAKLLRINPALSRKRLSRARYWLKNVLVENSKVKNDFRYPKSS